MPKKIRGPWSKKFENRCFTVRPGVPWCSSPTRLTHLLQWQLVLLQMSYVALEVIALAAMRLVVTITVATCC